jgi:type I restriction enzyme R subunit
MAKGIKELHVEEDFERYLTHAKDLFGSTEYTSVDKKLYDKDLCVIPFEVIAFIKETQPKKYKALSKQYGYDVEQKIVFNISRALDTNKTLQVLREGVKDRGQYLKLAFFKPSNNKTPDHEEWYKKNRLSVVRQLNYSKKNEKSVDIVLFVNGIPVVTVEIKNALTGQTHHNAIKQYIKDRNPKGEKFLEHQRCLVHFAVGTEKVFMTTQLKGKNTYFLPFNQALENHNPDGFATSYLWEDVLRKDSLLDLIQNYINLQTDKETIFDPKQRRLVEKVSSKLLFPRYHQRRAVERLLSQLKEDGTGKNYLVQHSAGSGKSNTITWLTYKLANFYQNYTDEKALYDSIIVVTDRKVLNSQIQENIRQFDNTPGAVAYINEKKTSQDLKKAIEDRKRIIITTLQKFPIISSEVGRYPDRRYAILIDEAHSSQSGEAARHMRKSLSLEEAAALDPEPKTLDDIIAEEIASKGQQDNISQFAFTATPKPKTIEQFGTYINGQKDAFDTYTMEQAIKEGFILDVLENYMSFKRYYKLVKRSNIPDKSYEKKKALRVLANYVDLQDHAIETKSRIILEHFASQTQNEIQGKARAMLVTRSRLHAVRFKRKFDDLMREMRLPYKALVAFSGTVKDSETGEEYTESNMNSLPPKISIQLALKLPEYRMLIVANKYQTGFDEPLMHTMFVDKKLGGTSTVQTLSRLNRRTQGKDSTMVLDFVNDTEQVQEDFQRYYGSNYMQEENFTDPNKLYEVADAITAAGIIYPQDIESFAEIFFTPENDFEKLQPILNEVVNRYRNDMLEEQQAEFKSNLKSFIKLYRFLSQIITFQDVELEKAYVFYIALAKKLPRERINLPFDVVEDVQLDSFKIQHQFTTSLSLSSEDTELEGLSSGGSKGSDDEELEFLSKIIKALNDTYGLDLTDEDRVEFEKMKESINANDNLMSYFNEKNSKDNIRDKFNDEIDNELLNFINTKLDFYNKMTEDKANSLLKALWFNEIYDSRVRGI